MFKYMFGKLKEMNKERLSILIDKISKESGKSKSYVLLINDVNPTVVNNIR